MVYTKRRYKRRGKRPGLATRPRFIPRGLALKRYQAVDTKVFYFKRNNKAESDVDGNYFAQFHARQVTDTPALFPQFTAIKNLYDQFKVLAIKIRFFPANVGVEPDSSIFGPVNALFRGQTVIWNDQRRDGISQQPDNISQIINNSSMRMVNSRRQFSRTIYRAKGFPEWANLQDPPTDDSWNGVVNVFVQGATPASLTPPIITPILYFFTVSYKCIFRGRVTE